MSDARSAARVHALIKFQIMRGGWPPAHTLNLREIAEASGTSVLPVRDALQRLVGEGLVDARAGGGFRMPVFSADDIAHLYAWHRDLIGLALQARGEPMEVSTLYCDVDIFDRFGVADATADFFNTLGTASPNPEHARAIRAVGERLHRIRIVETAVLKPREELAALVNVAASVPNAPLRRMVVAYHRRRIRCASTLALAVYTRSAEVAGNPSRIGYV